VSEQRSTGDVLLKVEEMHTFYGTIEALKGISIEVREGEIVTLIGATTENPYYEVNSALISRTQVYELEALTHAVVDRER